MELFLIETKCKLQVLEFDMKMKLLAERTNSNTNTNNANRASNSIQGIENDLFFAHDGEKLPLPLPSTEDNGDDANTDEILKPKIQLLEPNPK